MRNVMVSAGIAAKLSSIGAAVYDTQAHCFFSNTCKCLMLLAVAGLNFY